MPRIDDHPVLGPRRPGRPVTIFLDGRPLQAEEGEPIAAALWAHDVRALRWTRKLGEPRGVFCALGRCTDCVMTVDGRPNVRTCVTAVREGMRVERQGPAAPPVPLSVEASPPAPLRSGEGSTAERSTAERSTAEASAVGPAVPPLSGTERGTGGEAAAAASVAVIGAGPAGLCAALAAAKAGAQVVLYDENDQPGGQLAKQIHRFFGSREHHAGVRGFEIGELLVQRAVEAGVRICLNTAVFGIFSETPEGRPGLCLGLYSPGSRVRFVAPQRLIIAVGASERALPFPGWTLPGVMGAGAAQTLMNIHRVLPGRRVLMVGSGNVGLIVSYQLLQAGAQVVAVVEAMPRVGGYEVHAAKLRREGVPILPGHSVAAAWGEERVQGATIGELDEAGGFRPETLRDLEVDLVGLAVGLTPQVELARMAGCPLDWNPDFGGHVVRTDADMRTTVAEVYVAGDLAGIEEASTAMEEGTLAGIACAQSLGLSAETAEVGKREARRRLAALRAVASPPAPLRSGEGSTAEAAGHDVRPLSHHSGAAPEAVPPLSGTERGPGGEAKASAHRVVGVANAHKVAFARAQRKEATLGERHLWSRLRNRQLGVRFRRQRPLGDFVLDFYCAEARLAVEIDGPGHDEQVGYDQWRDRQLAGLGIGVLRVASDDVHRRVEDVVQRIRAALAVVVATASPPAPLRSGEGSTAEGSTAEGSTARHGVGSVSGEGSTAAQDVPPLSGTERGTGGEAAVAVIECPQAIPCNPCELACPFGAITVGEEITAPPVLDASRCNGCGKCVRECPGLAIFLVVRGGEGRPGSVTVPFELPGLPREGEAVTAVDREGRAVCEAVVSRVSGHPQAGETALVTLQVPGEEVGRVRSFRREN